MTTATATTTRKARKEFSLTAFSDEIVADMVRIARRGTHVRRGQKAINRKMFETLEARGWGYWDICQFARNCRDMAALELNAD